VALSVVFVWAYWAMGQQIVNTTANINGKIDFETKLLVALAREVPRELINIRAGVDGAASSIGSIEWQLRDIDSTLYDISLALQYRR
jgi:predicted PurR-regulated permease PerM